MLDVGAMPRRPAYDMAPEGPLLLYATAFAKDALEWRLSKDANARAVAAVQARWNRLAISAALTRDVHLAVAGSEVGGSLGELGGGSYVALEKRPVGKSYEEKLEGVKPGKRQKQAAARQLEADE